MGQSYEEIYANELTIASDSPGLIYHNHNELHHVLSALIRAQDFLSTLDFFTPFRYQERVKVPPSDMVPKEPKAGVEGAPVDLGAGTGQTPSGTGGEGDKTSALEKPPMQTPLLPGVIAYWHKAQKAAGETGYALRDDGTWRLVVQAHAEDPDERDIGLVLRGYGAAIRRKFWAVDEVETDDERRKPNYRYYERTTVKEAWQQGFDIFFAAAVLNGPLVENRVAAEPKDREKRSVGLDEVLATARRAADDEIYQPKYRRVRGADNAVAVAAGLWRAGQVLSTGKLVDEILFRKGGDLFWFLNFVRSENPDLLRDMMALGLCPRVDRWPPTASIKDTVSPDAVKMIWHPNDMVAKTKPKAWLIFASVGDKKPVRLPLKGEKTGKEAIIFDFGEVRDGKEGEAQLSSSLGDGEKCYWTIETTMETSSDGKQEKHAFKWPLQDFVASMSSASVQGGGQDLYANSNSKLSVKGGSTDGRVNFGNRTIHSVLGGRKVLGGAVYTLRIMPAEADKPVPQELSQPAELKLRWLKTEDPGDATPGIYYLNQDTNRWGLVGNKRVGEREVMAMVTKAGSYALMVDHLPPQLEELEDAPDPFPVGLEGVNWNLSTKLSEPATLTVQIEDKDGKVFRTLLKEEQKPVGDLQVTWDGKDAEGKLVPDGTYTYRLVAIDESKRTAKPVTGTVTVISGDMGSAEGEVKLAAESKGRPQVHVAGTALSAECDAEGKFWLLGLTQGAHTFEFSAQGHFEEQLQAELKAKGAEITLPAVSLTNVAIKDLKSSSEVFTPDGDGDRDYLSISFSMTRECPLDVGVYDEDGAQVTMLQAGKAMAKGETVVVWQGTDEDDMPRPSGWYSVRFVAHSRSEGIPQGEVKVLLDRGLVKNATAFPYTFSPNDDGFDDSLEIGYNLENDALVTVRLLNRDSSLLKEVLKDDKQEAGWRIVTWDGKGIDGKTISDGRYAFEIRPKYLTGHESKTVRGEFSSDSVPPAIGRVEPLNGSVIKIGFPAITAKVFSDLSDIDPSQLKVKIDEQTALVDKFDEKAGIFSFTPKTSLGEGLHIAIAYAQDWAGNYAPPQAVSFKVEFGEGDQKFDDRTKPEVLDLQPAKSAVVYTATPLITAKVRDADSGIDQNNVLIHVNGERVSNAVKLFLPGKSGKSWDWYYYEKAIVLFDPLLGEIRYVPIDPMKEGKNHVSLEVMDRAGNKSAKAETVFEVVIDNDPPVISNLQPADRSTLARTEVTVSAKVEDVGKSGIVVETLRLMLDGKEISLGEKDFTLSKDTAELAIPLKSPLARNAQHVVQLTVRDHAGNLSQPAMAAFTIVEDGDPPRIDVISPRDKAVFTAKDDILLAAVLYDVGRSRVDESSVRLTVDGQPAQPDDPKTPETEGYLIVKGLLTWKIGTLAPGKHVVCISAKDRAGNVAQDAVWQCEVK
jgi:flagellar hook assembly protein FlgD